MDIVQFAQAGERAPGRDIEPQPLHRARREALALRTLPPPQESSFRRGQARDPGADAVDGMQVEQVTHTWGRRSAPAPRRHRAFQGRS